MIIKERANMSKMNDDFRESSDITDKDFYAAIEEGLKDFEEGRIHTSQEVLQAMHDEIDRVFDMKKR